MVDHIYTEDIIKLQLKSIETCGRRLLDALADLFFRMDGDGPSVADEIRGASVTSTKASSRASNEMRQSFGRVTVCG